MHSSRFFTYGKWAAGAAAAASFSAVVVNCSNWSPAKPSNIPENSGKWDYNWDKREPYALVKPSRKSEGGEVVPVSQDEMINTLEKKRSKAVRHIALIRHGQYNMKGEGDAERKLTELGISQAELLGKRLKKSGIKFDTLICSNMTRAIETADIVLKEIGQEDLCMENKDPLLREGAPCLPEPPVSNWHPELHYYKDGARIEAAFRKYFHRADIDTENDTYELVVCHANVIRYFFCRAMQFPPEAWLRISLNHCSLTIFSILPSGRVILRTLGDSGHLPVDKISTS